MFFLKRFKNLFEFKKYYKRYTKNIIVLLIVMLIASATGVVLSYLMSEQLIGITNQNVAMAIKFTIIILIAVTIHHINWYLWSRFHFKLAKLVASDIKKDMISNLLNTKYLKLKENSSGYYLERINDDVSEISMFLGNVAGTFVDVFTNVAFLIIVYFLSWQLGLLFTVGIIILFLIESYKVKLDLKNLEYVKLATEKTNSQFNEIIYGIKDIKGFGIKNAIFNKITNSNDELLTKVFKKNNQFELLSRVGTYLQWIIDSALVFLAMLWLLPSGQITIVVLLLVFNYKSLMYDTVGFFSKVKSYYINGEFYAKRVLEIINNTDKEKFGNNENQIENGKITIKNLSYSFKDKKILNNVNLKIKPKTLNVLIGSSGSGKTTLFMLLAKMYDAKNNQIFFDDKDINSFSEETLRNDICLINQEPFIFNDTILSNIKIVNQNASDEEVFEACKLANIYDEILAMPNGFETVLTENGTNISGGQRQRIEIARSYLCSSTKILLLDEPTSALDNENQIKLFENLKKLSCTKTIFVIAHKLNDYKYFDNIYELKNLEIKKI